MTACASWPIGVLVVISAAVGATGCTLERAADPADPGDPPGPSDIDDLLASEEQSLADLPRNGLSPSAINRETLTAQGTQDLIRAIMNGGLLNSTTLSTANRNWLRTSKNARDLMKYVASCALPSNVSMDPQIEIPGEDPVVWPGALGLCNATTEVFGNWAAALPTPACLELVSSCVLARVNALQKKVVISMRGESIDLMSLLPQVPVVEEFREDNGRPIASFQPACAPEEAGLGPMRNCAWKGRYVGSCIPDTMVTLQTTAPAMVRVCRGIHGCNQRATNTPWYAGVISSVDASPGNVSFTCPRNGVSLTARSYFAVMLASPAPGTSLPNNVDVTITSGNAWYPSSEAEVFTYREGAFFGNIFDAARSSSPTGNPYINLLVGYQYACHSEIWDNGAAHATDRLCANPNYSCFENAPGQCPDSCSMSTGSTQPIYTHCSAATPALRPWTYPITVYLNHPCDLARDLTTCKNAFPTAFTAN